MIRPLDDLCLLKEINTIDGINYNSAYLREKYPNKIVVIRHIAYIKKDILCENAQKKVTDLSGYIQLGELSHTIGAHKRLLLDRIYFMEDTLVNLFDYIKLCGVWFIKINDDMKELLIHKKPFVASLKDKDLIVDCKLLGDIKIGFY